MTWKLTKAEVQELQRILAEVIGYEHISMEDKLMVCLLTRLYKKLTIKLLTIKSKYSMKMDVEVEMAIYLYFKDEQFNPMNFGDNLLKKIIDNVQQQYS